jgi:hypothetical protein
MRFNLISGIHSSRQIFVGKGSSISYTFSRIPPKGFLREDYVAGFNRNLSAPK